MKYIVYCTRNNKNSKIYIGVHKTITPFKFDGYLGNGVYTYNKTFDATSAFQNAVKKYGAESFTRITLGVFDTEEEAYLREELIVTKEFIRRVDVYNMIPGGKHSNFITCDKPVSQYNIEGVLVKTFDSITEAANSIGTEPWFILKSCSAPTMTCKGYFWRNVSNDIKQKIDTDFISFDINKAIPVVQYSKAGYRIKVWGSIVEAAKALHCDKTSISGVCKGYKGRKVCGGYQWRYLTDKLETLEATDTKGGIPRKVIKLSKDGIFLDSYESVAEASFKSGISKPSIGKSAKQHKEVCGFRWEYV